MIYVTKYHLLISRVYYFSVWSQFAGRRCAALAHRLKVPNIVIGLTVVAFGTSTPELVVNIISSIEGSSALALGNVLGSNIFNIMAILGVTALFVPIGIKRSTTWIEIPLAVLAAVLILILANGEPAGIITRAE